MNLFIITAISVLIFINLICVFALILKTTKIENSILQNMQQNLNQNMQDIRSQLTHSFDNHTKTLGNHVKTLNTEVKQNLFQISQQVNQQLNAGFEKNSLTFNDVAKRLTIIDQAQQKITELSSNVVSLQEILSNKQSRGAFGEVQLSALIKNMVPEHHYALQYTLSNGKRADCILFLPKPTGNLIIDAKFPLESYQKSHDDSISEIDKNKIKQQFKIDIKTHINNIAEKYIISGETSDGALMFIPAEAIFAEIHASYPELVQYSHNKRVWLVSPTTMMAVMTTVRSVLKDESTRTQINIIQEHLQRLAEDFKRFDKRMGNLSRHIEQAHQDVSEVNTSAKKISQRFEKIDQLEIKQEEELISE